MLINIKYQTHQELSALIKKTGKATRSFFLKLKRKKPKDLDSHFHQLHEEAFRQFSCLNCGNCCSHISPVITQTDMERLAKYLKIKPSEFLQKYLYMDEDGDFVFKQRPCPFLGKDNYCSVYESRPKACREYPHTDRRKMHQILDLTEKNCEYCPVVFEIVEELKKKIKA